MNTSDIPLSVLSIESKLDFAIKCVNLIRARHARDVLFASTLANLEDSIQQATLSVARSYKQALTQEIGEADQKRGRCFILFRRHIEAEQFNDEDDNKRQASDLLMKIIRAHGTQLHRGGMSAESALLVSLFKDMESANAKAALETLGLTASMDKLQQAQNTFLQLQEQRDTLELSKEIPTKQEAENKLVENLHVFLNGIDFLAVSQSAKYGETGQLVQQVANRIVTSERIGRQEPKKTDETEVEAEPQATETEVKAEVEAEN